jgi:cytochrome c oxidase assembly factor CtaG
MTLLDAVLASLAMAYVWRWLRLRRRALNAVSAGRLWAFLSGTAVLWGAVASAIARLDSGHLTGHMIQHLLLGTVAAPLLCLGEPGRVFLHGSASRAPSRLLASLHPAVCWFAGTFVVIFWHVPAMFELGMRWHGLMQATFFACGLLFWLPVLEPWPTVSRWSRWSMPLYLFMATLPCDVLSAFLTFCGRVVYPHYAALNESCGGLSPLEDQARAGALMWFWVTFAYLVPATLVTLDILSPRNAVPTLSPGVTRRV